MGQIEFLGPLPGSLQDAIRSPAVCGGWAAGMGRGESPPEVPRAVEAALAGGRPPSELRCRLNLMLLGL